MRWPWDPPFSPTDLDMLRDRLGKCPRRAGYIFIALTKRVPGEERQGEGAADCKPLRRNAGEVHF